MKYFDSCRFKYDVAAALVLGGLALGAGGALAMPNGLASVPAAAPSNVEDIGWVCGPYRCWGRLGWDRDLTASMARARGGGAGTTGIAGDCKLRVEQRTPPARFILSVSAVALAPRTTSALTGRLASATSH
jgi:hypothetical protein